MLEELIPPLRPLEMTPLEQDGETVIVMRDTSGVSEAVLTIPLPAYFIISCFDGKRTAQQAAQAFQRQFDQPISPEQVQSLAEQLDSHCMLQNATYEQRLREVESAYLGLPARPAAHAGAAYPGDAAGFEATFKLYFELDGGAGPINGGSNGRTIRGLVSPHMDPRCSGVCASWAMKALAEAEPPDTFVILGTAHQSLPNLYSVSAKDYETPLGKVECDKEFIASLREKLGAERVAGELPHKNEHSIEFQVVYLHALYGEPPPFKIVPILCGSFHEMIASGVSPSENSELDAFCRAVSETAEASGKRVCYLAGADLSHMGRKFGDDEGLSDELIDSVRGRDLEMLKHVERLDSEEFFFNLHAEGDARKVCGLPPMYTMMRCMNAAEGKLLKYDYNIDPQTDSMVSFCSMAFYS